MTAGPPPPSSSLVLYQTEDGRTKVQCRFEEETIWLTQAQMAELFQVTVPNVNLHLKAILAEGEVDPEATVKSYLIVQTEGARRISREVLHYSLPAVLAVGYRIRSPRGTQFRQWATARLEEFLVKGFVLDDERLKNPPGSGVPDYFDDLLERIRDIRASERRMYLRVRDILALAADYAPKTEETQRIFQIVQNKLHHAVTGMTAPELIAARADAAQPNMGLTTWTGASVRKHDVVMFLDFAEDQAQRRKQVFLRDWQQKLDDFLRFNERKVLPDAGHVTREAADRKAGAEYEHFAKRRRLAAESQGETDSMRALEAAAKALPKRTGRKGGHA